MGARKKTSGGTVLGSGALGSVVDLSEVSNITYYNEKLEEMKIRPDTCRIVFKRYIESTGNEMKESLDKVLRKISKLVNDIDFDLKDECLREIANNARAATTIQDYTPLLQTTRYGFVTFAVVNDSHIYPVYKRYAGDLDSVVDLGEVSNITYYNEKLEEMEIRPDTCRIVFKRYIESTGNELKESLDKVLRKISKLVNDIDLDLKYECLREIANNARAANIIREYIPLLSTRSGFVTFAVVNDSHIYPVYERYAGDLLALLKNTPQLTKPVLYTLVDTMLQITKLLHDADIFHNDIKPANILFKKTRTGAYKFALADFGFLSSSQNMTLAGTPRYQSPIINFMEHFECEDHQIDCESKYESFEAMSHFFMMFGNQMSLASGECKKVGTGSDDVTFAIQRCNDFKVEYENVILNPSVAADKQWSFLTLVSASLNRLCTGGVPARATRARCADIDTVSKAIMGFIFQKNELYAIGVTIEDVMKKGKYVIGNDTAFKTFISKLTHGDVRTDYYDIDNALNDWRKIHS